MVIRHDQRGWTFIELLIVVGIIGAIALLGPTLFTNLLRFYYLHNAKIEIQRDARVCLDIINRYLRQAKAASVTIDQMPIAGGGTQPPYSRITFTTVNNEVMSFYQEGLNLVHSFGNGAHTAVLSKNLRYIAFTYPRSDDPTIISVSMTMERGTYQGGFKALELSVEKVRVMN